MTVHPDLCHELLAKKITPRLAFDEGKDYEAWRNTVRESLCRRLGYESILANRAEDDRFEIEWERDRGDHRLIRFTFESEIGETVPCYLLIPNTGKEKYPVAITMQGHSTGFHNSIGEKKYDKDEDYHPRGQFALQAVQNGYAALAIEQRGMGERMAQRQDRRKKNQEIDLCRFAARVAIHMGRTILGERVFDISCAIDQLSRFPALDTEKILITGNSGGGTISYYAAAMDERIRLSVPSCAFCPYPESILDVLHCDCNYVPGAYCDFDMQDLACLIAPRPLVVVAGKDDPIFPIDGVKRGMETVERIYRTAGAPDACRTVVTPKAHWWCADLVWENIRRETKRLGW